MKLIASDTRNLLKPFTFQKAWNSFLLRFSYLLSRISRKPVLWGFPESISIEPTTHCNLHCPECPSGQNLFSRPQGWMKPDNFKAIIDSMHQHLVYLILYFQGEPFLNPHFFEMVQYAAQKNIYVATSTNAHFLSLENARKTIESGLHRIIVSLDGADAESYSKYRIGGDFNKVLEGIRRLVAAKKENRSRTPHIILQFIVFRTNEHQVGEIKKLGRELGVDEVQIKSAQIYDYENGNGLIPKNEKYSRYKKQKDGTYRIKNDFKNQCWRMWHSCVLSWDGRVIPCCFDKDAKYLMGSLKNEAFTDIWKGSRYQNFRRKIFTSRKSIDICRNCTEGMGRD